MFFPDKAKIEEKNPKIPYANNIIYHNLIIFGFPGSGKTTTVNSLAGYASDKYGSNNLTSLFSEDGDLEALINSFTPNLANILYTDNATLAKYNKSTLHKYFMLRNIIHNKYGITNAYILSIIALHRYFSIPVEFRSVIDGLLIRDISINPYDNAILSKFIGNEELFELLKHISSQRSEQKSLLNLSVFVGKDIRGLVYLPARPTFYFKEPSRTFSKMILPNGDIDFGEYYRKYCTAE
jgi:hypothetical protein